MSKTVIDALEKFQALLALEKMTGSKTTRARNEILRKLNDEDLTDFAVALKRGNGHAGNIR